MALSIPTTPEKSPGEEGDNDEWKVEKIPLRLRIIVVYLLWKTDYMIATRPFLYVLSWLCGFVISPTKICRTCFHDP